MRSQIETALPRRPILAVDLPAVEAFELTGPSLSTRLHEVDPVELPLVVPEGAGEAGLEGDWTSPPMPLAILPNWIVPRSVRGMQIDVRVFVTSVGRAVGPVRLVPPTPDRGFNRRVAERVRRIDYRPARHNGQPVGAWVEIAFVFCPTTVTATSPPPSAPEASHPCPRPAGATARSARNGTVRSN